MFGSGGQPGKRLGAGGQATRSRRASDSEQAGEPGGERKPGPKAPSHPADRGLAVGPTGRVGSPGPRFLPPARGVDECRGGEQGRTPPAAQCLTLVKHWF